LTRSRRGGRKPTSQVGSSPLDQHGILAQPRRYELIESQAALIDDAMIVHGESLRRGNSLPLDLSADQGEPVTEAERGLQKRSKATKGLFRPIAATTAPARLGFISPVTRAAF